MSDPAQFNSRRLGTESETPHLTGKPEPETSVDPSADAGLRKFAGHMAHDFNNLLTVIRGYAQSLIDEDELNGTALEALQQIDLAARRAADLTSQMLTLSRTDLPHREYLDLNDVIAQFSKISRPPASKEIALLFQHSGGSLGIYADRAMIEQVLSGIVNYSSSAARSGGTVWIRTEEVSISVAMLRRFPKARVGRFVCISIKDNGAGISADALSQVFEPFSMATEAGTGLMLAAASHAVKQHEGWMDVESEPGRGTTFRIFLPLIVKTCFGVRERWAGVTSARGHETILLVESEDSVRGLAAKILNREGYQVIEARSGAEAIASLQQQNARVDLLLVGWEMADGGSGRELSMKLQRLYPELRTVYTTNCNADVREHALHEESKLQFLSKPYSLSDLTLAVRHGLEAPVSKREYPSALLAN